MLLTFAGEDYDDVVNLIFLRARYYSPSLKRFISEDDFPGIPTVPISLNRYIYCHNSPISYVDPTGHIVWIPIVLLIGGVISTAEYHFFTPPEKRSSIGYALSFIVGVAATGLGMGVGQLIGGFTGGIVGGAVAEAAETAGLDLLEGKSLWETVMDTAISAAIGAGIGYIVPKMIPALRFRGPAPSLQWYKGWPIGGYVGKNTYRYLKALAVSTILGKAAEIYVSWLIEDVFVAPPYPPSGTLVVQLNKRW
ncbi:RHS repeat-associated core domain-containing protein [Candidatus Methanodesulfokora washburnensis]|uniref:RHS repeat-associated core domain-containing protein n=1 Tax=Candidatus Methanodesulfokora washburnensis TaxID=2478471 RepID=UPI0013872CDC|nr:RHS repeat-associated core domain-containing protein [Candidatus Methanodesulfokores washburnensis]